MTDSEEIELLVTGFRQLQLQLQVQSIRQRQDRVLVEVPDIAVNVEDHFRRELERRHLKGTVSWYLGTTYVDWYLVNRPHDLADELGWTQDEVAEAVQLLRRIWPHFVTSALETPLEPEGRVVQVGDRNGAHVLLYSDGFLSTPYSHHALRVVEVLLKLQRKFFEFGPRFMYSLSKRSVGEQLGFDSTLMSRACRGVVVITEKGGYSIDEFLSESMVTTAGVPLSVLAVRERVRLLLESEDPDNPSPDWLIAEHLERIGLKMARRTVHKYRQMVGVASARTRRKLSEGPGKS